MSDEKKSASTGSPVKALAQIFSIAEKKTPSAKRLEDKSKRATD